MPKEQNPPGFDKTVLADGKEYGLNAVTVNVPESQKQLGAAVLVTDTETKKQFILRPIELDDGVVVNAAINPASDGQLMGASIKPADIPAELREALASELSRGLKQTGVGVNEQMLENLREGKAVLKPDLKVHREANAAFERIMENTNLDAEIAENMADNRVDTLLDELNAALKSGDKEAQETVKAQLKAATAEQPAMDEAAEKLAKPTNHFARQEFEAKRLGDVVEGEQIEEGHVARLKAQRDAEAQRKTDGPAV